MIMSLFPIFKVDVISSPRRSCKHGELIQQLVNGISLGSIYALIALGYTMVYGIVKLINFAHGDVFMVGAFIGFYSITFFTLEFFPSINYFNGCLCISLESLSRELPINL